MFVRRPGGPVAGLAESHAGQDAAGLHVLADHDMEIALARRATGREVQVRVAAHCGESDELQRILPRHRSRDLREIAARGILVYGVGYGGGYADGVISRDVQRIVGGEGETLRCDFDGGAAMER